MSDEWVRRSERATRFLMERSLSPTHIRDMGQGAQTYSYIDEPALSAAELVARIYRLLDKTPPSWHIPLSIATPLAKVFDLAADISGIDFTGVRRAERFMQ